MKIHNSKFVGNDAIDIADGNIEVFKIPAPPEGQVVRVSVHQSLGSDVAATLDLYFKETLPEGEGAQSPIPDEDQWRICPSISVGAGGTTIEYYRENAYPYRTEDGTTTVPTRYIWGHLAPSSPGEDTEWEVIVTTKSEVPY